LFREDETRRARVRPSIYSISTIRFRIHFSRIPFAQFGERRDIQISSDPVALEVKPLPPNAPPSFSGAIGSFTMATDAKPKSVQVGDPITVTTTISGRGNFDRVNAPLLEDDRWLA
jgi:hypothetical protein